MMRDINCGRYEAGKDRGWNRERDGKRGMKEKKKWLLAVAAGYYEEGEALVSIILIGLHPYSIKVFVLDKTGRPADMR